MKKCNECRNDLPDNSEYFHVKLTAISCELSKVCIYCTNRSRVTKECCKCRTVYPAALEYFNSDKRGKLGLSGRCKNCMMKAKLEKY